MDHTIVEAQQIGRKYALWATLVTELLVTGVLLTFLLSSTGTIDFFGWVSLPAIIVFMFSTVVFSYLLGQRLGVETLVKKNKNPWAHYLAAVAIVLLSTVVASSLTFIIHFLSGDLINDYLFHYLIKPIVWIIPLSIFPILIAGTWYRNQLNKVG